MNDQKPKSKKRWFQFSLRSFLLFYLIFPPLLIAGGYEWYQSTKRMEEVAQERKKNRRVIFKYEIDRNGYLNPVAKPWIAERFSRIFMIDESDSIDELARKEPRVRVTTLLKHNGDLSEDLRYLSEVDEFIEFEFDCEMRKRIPSFLDGIETQKHLERLRLPGNDWQKSPNAIDISRLDGLPKLKTLDIYFCSVDGFEKVRLDNLTKLKLSGVAIDKLDLKRFAALEDVTIANCYGLEEIDLGGLENLKKLTIQSQSIHRLVVDQWNKLESLKISDCRFLKSIEGFESTHCLRSLQLMRCPNLENDIVSAHSKPELLEALKVLGCPKLPAFQVGKTFSELRQLELYNSQCKVVLEELGDMTKLENLSLFGVTSTPNLQAFASLNDLTSLSLSDDPELTELSGIETLTRLKALDILACSSLKSLNGLPDTNTLQSIRLTDCRSLTDIGALSQFESLTLLDLSGTESLMDFSPIYEIRGVLSLNIRGRRLASETVLELESRFPNALWIEKWPKVPATNELPSDPRSPGQPD